MSVACRMSWASRRSTTRIEDTAYCLLGIFDVNMSLIYGEQEKAFSRLQEGIIQATGDLTIFAWTNTDEGCPDYTGFFADCPRRFDACSEMQTTLEDSIYRDLKITTRGVQLEASLVHLFLPEITHQPTLDVFCKQGLDSVGVYLRKIGGGRYARWKPGLLSFFRYIPIRGMAWIPHASANYGDLTTASASMKYLATNLPVEMLLLPMNLLDTFPFHPSNPVLGNRHSVLRMPLEMEDSLPMELVRHTAYPRSHWDRHDGVFFCSNRISTSWCASFIQLKEAYGKTQGGPLLTRDVGIFVACFFWNHAPATKVLVMLAALDSISPAAASMFEVNLDRVRFESASTGASMLIRRTFGEALQVSETQDGSLTVGVGDVAQATVVLRGGVSSPDVCVRPITSVDISVGKKMANHTVDVSTPGPSPSWLKLRTWLSPVSHML